MLRPDNCGSRDASNMSSRIEPLQYGFEPERRAVGVVINKDEYISGGFIRSPISDGGKGPLLPTDNDFVRFYCLLCDTV